MIRQVDRVSKILIHHLIRNIHFLGFFYVLSFVIIVNITGSVFLSRGERQTNIIPVSVFLSR